MVLIFRQFTTHILDVPSKAVKEAVSTTAKLREKQDHGSSWQRSMTTNVRSASALDSIGHTGKAGQHSGLMPSRSVFHGSWPCSQTQYKHTNGALFLYSNNIKAFSWGCAPQPAPGLKGLVVVVGRDHNHRLAGNAPCSRLLQRLETAQQLLGGGASGGLKAQAFHEQVRHRLGALVRYRCQAQLASYRTLACAQHAQRVRATMVPLH